MGFLTLDDFRDDLNLALGDINESDNDRLDRWINNGVQELAMILCPASLVNCVTLDTTADIREYGVPADFLAVISIYDLTNKRRLVGMADRTSHLYDREETGEPKLYARVGDSIIIWPTPNVVFNFEMYYLQEPAILSLGTDITVMPNWTDHAVNLLALRMALLGKSKGQEATVVFQTAMRYIRSIPTDEELNEQQITLPTDVARSFDDMSKARTSVG